MTDFIELPDDHVQKPEEVFQEICKLPRRKQIQHAPRAIIKIGGDLAIVPLTQRAFALIDAVDIPVVAKYNWQASVTKTATYACHGFSKVGGRKGKKPASIQMHRLIANAPDDMWVDHKNGLSLDNRRSNLRICTPSQNRVNYVKFAHGINSKYSSQYRGVSADVRHPYWYSTICFEGRTQHLGTFRDEIEAARAYDRAAKQIFGPFARLNFPEEETVSSDSFFIGENGLDQDQSDPTRVKVKPGGVYD